MVPIPHEYTYDFWVTGPTESTELTCLMPNGIIILLNANHDATISEIKADLWEEAAKYPLHGTLHDMSVYAVTCINSMAEVEEIDELRLLCDVRPTGAVLKITECIGNKVDTSLNVQIGHLIGKRLNEFDSLNSVEINDFRFKMRKLGEDVAAERLNLKWSDKVYYQFPPRTNNNDIGIDCDNKKVTIKFEKEEISFTFHVSAEMTPTKLLETSFNKKCNVLKTNERWEYYILKVCGQDEFLIKECPLIQYQYIQDMFAKDINPTLIAIHKDSVPITKDRVYECVDAFDNKKPWSIPTTLNRKKGKYKSAWDITDNFSITLSTVSGVNCDYKRNVDIGIQVGIFHGGKCLCQTQKTTEKAMKENCELEFNETLVFDIAVCNIPRSVKLCFVVYEVTKNSKGTKTRKIKESVNKCINPVAWANTTVYDFKNQLRSGAMTLYMWTYAEDVMSDDVFHALGTVVSNPNNKYATALTLKFNSYSQDLTVMYPTVDIIINYAKSHRHKQDLINQEKPPDVEVYRKLLYDSDNLYEVHDQDRKNVWSLRRYWMNTQPEFLPKLLYCIDWDNRDEVSEIIMLLRDWPKLPPERALELLDYAYAEQEVRSFAVNCLVDMSDEDLLLYLLQLVQAIKHELYLNCDLVIFLLNRALHNQKIGHYLFWHLRAEMQVASVSVRFGLILEAYCRGSQEHIHYLTKQLDCSERLKKCNEFVRTKKDKEKGKAALRDYLDKPSTIEAIQHIRSPLDPSYRWSRIKIKECRVMDSKMRPLWFVFENSDVFGEDVFIIFKHGDDLRQDMLTLQMLRIMDRLWKREGLDLRMNPYNCISMENQIGMIEVVLHAETIANIQREKGMFTATAAFKKGSLLAWLKDYNPNEAQLKKAINEFTLSCAGYCVATYVLGIGDRHSDNIMIKKTGQLFHIDFGHILGHFKEKFGFKRERAPFVLTHDFVHVINRGQKGNIEFAIFQEYCEKAFTILRKNSNLIISLCAMMISTGLPELSSEKDLNYLRETLAVAKTEEDAILHFKTKFVEALSNSWSTSLNWATHNLAKNNIP